MLSVIFDMDGTLIDTMSVYGKSMGSRRQRAGNIRNERAYKDGLRYERYRPDELYPIEAPEH